VEETVIRLRERQQETLENISKVITYLGTGILVGLGPVILTFFLKIQYASCVFGLALKS
jgi:hypothetical protein